jgi:hypothetical protein
MGVRNERRGWVFIGKVCHQLLDQSSGRLATLAYVRAIAQWSKGCLVRPSIIQRILQKVAYVWWSHVRPLYGLQSIRLVVSPCTSALQTEAYIRLT